MTGLGLGWFGGGAWGQGGAPEDGGGQEKSEENMGVGSPGVRRGEGVTLALTTSVGQDSDTSWMQVCGGERTQAL